MCFNWEPRNGEQQRFDGKQQQRTITSSIIVGLVGLAHSLWRCPYFSIPFWYFCVSRTPCFLVGSHNSRETTTSCCFEECNSVRPAGSLHCQFRPSFRAHRLSTYNNLSARHVLPGSKLAIVFSLAYCWCHHPISRSVTLLCNLKYPDLKC